MGGRKSINALIFIIFSSTIAPNLFFMYKKYGYCSSVFILFIHSSRQKKSSLSHAVPYGFLRIQLKIQSAIKEDF